MSKQRAICQSAPGFCRLFSDWQRPQMSWYHSQIAVAAFGLSLSFKTEHVHRNPTSYFNYINKLHIYLFSHASVIHIARIPFSNWLSRVFSCMFGAPNRTDICTNQDTPMPPPNHLRTNPRIRYIIYSQEFLSFRRIDDYALCTSEWSIYPSSAACGGLPPSPEVIHSSTSCRRNFHNLPTL